MGAQLRGKGLIAVRSCLLFMGHQVAQCGFYDTTADPTLLGGVDGFGVVASMVVGDLDLLPNQWGCFDQDKAMNHPSARQSIHARQYHKRLVHRGRSHGGWRGRDGDHGHHRVHPHKRGGPMVACDLAIALCLRLKAVDHLPYRATEGALRPLCGIGKPFP